MVFVTSTFCKGDFQKISTTQKVSLQFPQLCLIQTNIVCPLKEKEWLRIKCPAVMSTALPFKRKLGGNFARYSNWAFHYKSQYMQVKDIACDQDCQSFPQPAMSPFSRLVFFNH